MGSRKMTNTKCARCTRHLAADNTNPHGLCGYCQREISGDKWAREGKPTISGPSQGAPKAQRSAPRPHNRRPNGTPDPKDLPTTFLISCAKELKRRAQEAKSIVAAMKGL